MEIWKNEKCVTKLKSKLALDIIFAKQWWRLNPIVIQNVIVCI